MIKSLRKHMASALAVGVICALCPVSGTYAGMAEIRVATGNDDAEQHLDDNRIDLGSSDLELGEEGAGDFQEVGIRFIDIPVGPGVNIDSSFIQFTVDELNDEATSLRIFGELTPNSAQFTAAANDITDRTKTTSFVDWNSIPAWTNAGDAGADQRTPSLTPILNEIFGQATWASGNALSFIVVPNPGGERTAESFNGSSNQAPQLVFTGASVPDVVLPPPPPPPPAPTGNAGTILGTGTGSLLGGDLTDPEDDGDPEANTNYNVDFFSTVEAGFAGGESAFNTFDNVLGPGNDKWCCDLPNVSGPNGHFLDVHLTENGPTQLTHFTISSANDVPDRDPLDWKIQGSVDGQNWTTIFERAGDDPVWNDRLQVVLFEEGKDFDSTGEGYTWFRFNPTRVAGNLFQIGEIEYFGIPFVDDFFISGNGETYFEDFDSMGVKTGITPTGWEGVDNDGSSRSIDGLGLTDGFLTVPGNDGDGVLGVLNLGGNSDSFGPSPNGQIETWSAELGGADGNLYDQGDVVADNATDRALGVSRVDNDDTGELNFEIEIADATLRAFVFDWDLEIWGGDPDSVYRSAEGPGMKVDLKVGGTTYYEEAKNLLPGDKFDSTEDGSNDHNPTLIDGNVHSIRGMTSGIREVSDADGAVGNSVQVNFNSNWNGDLNDSANGWITAVDNVRLRALAPGDADANGVVDVTDLLALLGGQKFNQGVDGVTWEQGDFNADDQFDTSDLLAMLSFLSGTFPSDPYASEAGGASDAVADIIVNSETGEVTVDLAGHTVSAIIIESASEIFNGSQPEWDTTSQFPSTLPGELGNVLFTSTASGTDELGAVISAEFLGRDKDFYLQDLDLNILIASEGGTLVKGNVIVVPEPSTWMLLGLGSLAIVGVIRRRMA